MCGAFCGKQQDKKSALYVERPKPEQYDADILRISKDIERTKELIAEKNEYLKKLVLQEVALEKPDEALKLHMEAESKLSANLEKKLIELNKELAIYQNLKIEAIGNNDIDKHAKLLEDAHKKNTINLIAKDKMNKNLEKIQNQKELQDAMDKEIEDKQKKIEEPDRLKAERILAELRAKHSTTSSTTSSQQIGPGGSPGKNKQNAPADGLPSPIRYESKVFSLPTQDNPFSNPTPPPATHSDLAGARKTPVAQTNTKPFVSALDFATDH